MRLSEIIYDGEYSSSYVPHDIHIDNIATVAKEICKGTLFILLNSKSLNNKKAIAEILEKQPRAIIAEHTADIYDTKIPIFRCESTRRILSLALARFYKIDFDKMRFIAVTGTNGKTTTATLLEKILSYSGRKTGFIGTGRISIGDKTITPYDYSMTTPDPEMLYKVIKEMETDGCQDVIMEASSHSLFFEKLAPIKFKVGIFTNLTPEHMDFHKDMESYYQTKLKLFSGCEIGIFNNDDPYSKRASGEVLCQAISIGIISDADAVIRGIEMRGLMGTDYLYCDQNRIFKVRLKLGGPHNVYNSMLAISAAITLGVKAYIAKEALEAIDRIDGRLECFFEDITVIIDYAHTSAAFENLLKFVKSTKNQGQNIVSVFGCGGERDKKKRPKMAEIVEKYADSIIITNDNPRCEPEEDIIADIIKGFSADANYKIVLPRSEAVREAIINATPNDIVLFIGKGCEKYTIDKNGKHSYDETEIIKSLLMQRRKTERI